MNIIKTAASLLTNSQREEIILNHLRREFKDSLRRACVKSDDPTRIIGIACEKLQRHMNADATHQFRTELHQNGIDCRDQIKKSGPWFVDTIDQALDYLQATSNGLHRDIRRVR